MTIEAELPDGTILEFPDGTDQNVIQSVVRKQLGISQDQPAVQKDNGFDLESFDPAGEIAVQPAQQFEKPSLIPSALQPQAAMITGAIAEPVAGIAGLGSALISGDSGVGAETVEKVRESLTFQPDPSGQPGLQRVGEILRPVGEAFQATERFLGDAAFDLTGSPALAAAAATAPTAVLEALGGLGVVAKKGGKIKRTGQESFKVSAKQIDKAMIEAVPDIDRIKDTSRAIYKEIDNLDVKVRPQAVNSMLKTVARRAKKEGVDKVLTPKSQRVVELFDFETQNRELRNVSDLDRLRQQAQKAAQSLEPSDARVGSIMVDEIDSFMDNIPPQAFTGEIALEVGERYKSARKLWGRARRSELMQEAMDKAQRQASGFENGIRIQLRQILNNKKRSRFFTKDELAAMNDVVQGTNQQNFLKLVGRLGFSEGQATNILGGLAGGAVGGPLVPVVGQVSRKLAQRSTAKSAKLSDAIVKAGPDGRKITEAYLRLTPKANRSPLELADIFLGGGADIDNLLKSGNKVAKEAAEIARGRKAFLSGAAATGAVTESIRSEDQ